MRRPSGNVTANPHCLMHDMTVGQDESVGREDKSRAPALSFARFA